MDEKRRTGVMSSRILRSSFAALALVAAACGGNVYSVGSDQNAEQGGNPPGGGTDSGVASDAGNATDSGAACTTNADCGTGHQCGFPQIDACGAKGKCFDAPGGAICALGMPGCACDGTVINIASCATGLPSGYVTKPLLHSGACEADGGGGAADAAAPCATSQECPTGYECGFPQAEACTAKGTCFASSGVVCQAYSPGCACDGTIVNVVCNGLPGGYETKPLRHTGLCNDAGM
jgi:hypothetical protein